MTMLSNAAVRASGGGIDVGDIEQSLRFRSSASAYLSKSYTGGVSPADSSVYKKFISFKVKRGKLGAAQIIFSNGFAGTDRWLIYFDAADTLVLIAYSSAVITLFLTSTAVFRDVGSHYHIDILQDVTQATAGNRTTVWVNGSVITMTGTTATLNNPVAGFFLAQLGRTCNARVGNDFVSGVGVSQLDGYVSRFCVVDNPSGLSASSFGYLNTNINEWVSNSQSAVKAVVDAGGTNSFMLDFDDGTSLTTLGYDKSSKGNNWTLNNISLTAGSTYDWMLDVPGNSYATLNPLDNIASPSPTYLNANLSGTVTGSAITYSQILGTQSVSGGKWYVETTATSANRLVIGFSQPNGLSTTKGTGISGVNCVVYRSDTGEKIINGATSAYGATFTTNDVIGIALDLDNLQCTFYKNNVSQGLITGLTAGEYTLNARSGDSSALVAAFNANFGQRPFAYTPPTGFLALCQANLPEPAILNPETNFDVVLDTGANIKATAEAVYPGDFFEWLKDRANANNHQLLDIVRGNTAVLQSSSTAAETTYAAPTGNSVGWLWKAGGAGAADNSGTEPVTRSSNVLAGFSILEWNGTGGTENLPHGLGSAVKFFIVKNRTDNVSWTIYHSAIGPTKVLAFDTAAAITDSTSFSNTAPTSSVIVVGSANSVNGAGGDDMVAYCFAEVEGYSKIGSYTGNASADGPYVHCGFKPKFVLVKRTDSTADWQVMDAVRNTTNVANAELNPNLSSAESTVTALDLLATGFKLRTTDAGYNASGGTYIFMAFADVPGKYSNAR